MLEALKSVPFSKFTDRINDFLAILENNPSDDVRREFIDQTRFVTRMKDYPGETPFDKLKWVIQKKATYLHREKLNLTTGGVTNVVEDNSEMIRDVVTRPLTFLYPEDIELDGPAEQIIKQAMWDGLCAAAEEFPGLVEKENLPFYLPWVDDMAIEATDENKINLEHFVKHEDRHLARLHSTGLFKPGQLAVTFNLGLVNDVMSGGNQKVGLISATSINYGVQNGDGKAVLEFYLAPNFPSGRDVLFALSQHAKAAILLILQKPFISILKQEYLEFLINTSRTVDVAISDSERDKIIEIIKGINQDIVFNTSKYIDSTLIKSIGNFRPSNLARLYEEM